LLALPDLSITLLQVLLLIAVELLGSKLILGRWALASAEGDAQPGSLLSDLLAPAKALQAARQQPRRAGKPATLQESAVLAGNQYGSPSGLVGGGGLALRLNGRSGVAHRGLQESEQQLQQDSPSVSGVVGLLSDEGSGEVPSSPRRSVRLQQRSRRVPMMISQ
jgi:hypothetical protein